MVTDDRSFAAPRDVELDVAHSPGFPFTRPVGSEARMFIQWKGTNVCLDFWCACGEAGHYDGDFAYHLKCPTCGQVYEMGTQVIARKVDGDDHPSTQVLDVDVYDEPSPVPAGPPARMWGIQHPDPANAKVGDEVEVTPVELGPRQGQRVNYIAFDETTSVDAMRAAHQLATNGLCWCGAHRVVESVELTHATHQRLVCSANPEHVQ